MLPARWRAARGAHAAVRRHFARHHHPDVDPLLSRPSRPRRGGYGDRQGVVAAGAGRRGRRQRHRALRAGAAFQDRVRRHGVDGRGAPAARARDLEVRRGSSAGSANENLWLPCRASVDADGHRRRAVFESADDLLQPADPSGGRDFVGAGGADLDSRHARLRLCRLACGGALSGCRRAAIAVCDRLRFADWRRAGDADQPFHRATRGQSRACDVQAHAGDGVWLLPFHRRRPVCDKSAERVVVTLILMTSCRRRCCAAVVLRLDSAQSRCRSGTFNMRRRAFIRFVGIAVKWPLRASAQQPTGKVTRIGYLGVASASEGARGAMALETGLRELGYLEGKSLVIEYRWANGRHELLDVLATELVRVPVDVIVAPTTAAALAARNATATIPIVFATVSAPVELRLVDSLARPGGNITGLKYYVSPEIVGKQHSCSSRSVPRYPASRFYGCQATRASPRYWQKPRKRRDY